MASRSFATGCHLAGAEAKSVHRSRRSSGRATVSPHTNHVLQIEVHQRWPLLTLGTCTSLCQQAAATQCALAIRGLHTVGTVPQQARPLSNQQAPVLPCPEVCEPVCNGCPGQPGPPKGRNKPQQAAARPAQPASCNLCSNRGDPPPSRPLRATGSMITRQRAMPRTCCTC